MTTKGKKLWELISEGRELRLKIEEAQEKREWKKMQVLEEKYLNVVKEIEKIGSSMAEKKEYKGKDNYD